MTSTYALASVYEVYGLVYGLESNQFVSHFQDFVSTQTHH